MSCKKIEHYAPPRGFRTEFDLEMQRKWGGACAPMPGPHVAPVHPHPHVVPAPYGPDGKHHPHVVPIHPHVVPVPYGPHGQHQPAHMSHYSGPLSTPSACTHRR